LATPAVASPQNYFNQMAKSGNVMVLLKTSLDTRFIVAASPDDTIASLKSMVSPLNL
jgi:hypothetical protein